MDGWVAPSALLSSIICFFQSGHELVNEEVLPSTSATQRNSRLSYKNRKRLMLKTTIHAKVQLTTLEEVRKGNSFSTSLTKGPLSSIDFQRLCLVFSISCFMVAWFLPFLFFACSSFNFLTASSYSSSLICSLKSESSLFLLLFSGCSPVDLTGR